MQCGLGQVTQKLTTGDYGSAAVEIKITVGLCGTALAMHSHSSLTPNTATFT